MVVDIPYPLARLEALRRMSLEDTVLSEVAPAAKNIQHPDEASEEHWVGVEGGLFKPCGLLWTCTSRWMQDLGERQGGIDGTVGAAAVVAFDAEMCDAAV